MAENSLLKRSLKYLRKIKNKLLKDWISLLTFVLTLGVVLMSLGIYIMGSNIFPFWGSRMIILGSGLFYVSVIALVFVID